MDFSNKGSRSTQPLWYSTNLSIDELVIDEMKTLVDAHFSKHNKNLDTISKP